MVFKIPNHLLEVACKGCGSNVLWPQPCAAGRTGTRAGRGASVPKAQCQPQGEPVLSWEPPTAKAVPVPAGI